MIEKILDNYYSKRLIDKLKMTECIYCLDFKNIIEKNEVVVYCKIRKYKDKNYTRIMNFPKKYVFYYLSNYDNFRNDIEECIKEYYKEERRDV
jgi:hypothetical protein